MSQSSVAVSIGKKAKLTGEHKNLLDTQHIRRVRDGLDLSAQHSHPYANNANSTNGKAIDYEKMLSGAYWGELRTFLGLAKAKSINRAADTLGLSKSTISRQIHRLQDLHGGTLAVLSKTGFHLTDQGERLAQILLAFDQSLSSIRTDAVEQFGGVVRLSVTDGLGILFVVPGLRKFTRSHPGISIRFRPPRNMTSLRENQTDIMLGFSQQVGSDLTCRRLGTMHLIPVASEDYVRSRGMPTRDNLAEHDFVDTDRYSARGGPWDPWHGLVASGRMVHEAETIVSYAMMVKAGLGIGLLASCNVIDPCFVPLDLGADVALPIHVTALADRLGSRPTRAVFDFLVDLLGPDNPWFGPALRLDERGTSADDGYAFLFNLPGRGLP